MDCKLCGNELAEDETLQHHLIHHVYDKQYGIKADGLAAALESFDVRLRKLESAPKAPERQLSTPAREEAVYKGGRVVSKF